MVVANFLTNLPYKEANVCDPVVYFLSFFIYENFQTFYIMNIIDEVNYDYEFQVHHR